MAALDPLNAFAGALTGLLLAGVVAIFKPRATRFLTKARSRQFLSTKRFELASLRLTWAYARWMRDDADFTARSGFLSRRCWNRNGNVAAPEVSLSVSNGAKKFPFNARVIERRIKTGQRLINNDAYYCDGVNERDGDLVISISCTKYYSIVSNVDSIERSSFIKRRLLESFRYRKSGSISSFRSVAFKPTLFGCSFVPVFVSDGGSIEILLHQRSLSTFTYGGMLTGLPNFGLAPIPSIDCGKDGISEPIEFWQSPVMTVLKYNFYKEYLEELCGFRELEDDEPVNVVSADWLESVPQIAELRRKIEIGAFRIEYLGFGFDALTLGGVIRYALMIYGDMEKDLFFRQLKTNWEFENNGIYPKLKLSTLDSEFIRSSLFMNKIHSAAAATILDLLNRYSAQFHT